MSLALENIYITSHVLDVKSPDWIAIPDTSSHKSESSVNSVANAVYQHEPHDCPSNSNDSKYASVPAKLSQEQSLKTPKEVLL